jgi:hypothetical protein
MSHARQIMQAKTPGNPIGWRSRPITSLQIPSHPRGTLLRSIARHDVCEAKPWYDPIIKDFNLVASFNCLDKAGPDASIVVPANCDYLPRY